MKPEKSQKHRIANSERRRASIQSVLDSALSLFVAQGYAATSIDDIARHASLTKGAVYFYFEDKLTLLEALLDRTEGELFVPIIAKVAASRGSARDRIVLLTNWFARIAASQKDTALLHLLVSLEMYGRDNKVEAKVRKTRSELLRAVSEVTRHGQITGEFTSDISPDCQAALIVALIDGLLLEWQRRNSEVDGPELARGTRNLILNGIAQVRQRA